MQWNPRSQSAQRVDGSKNTWRRTRGEPVIIELATIASWHDGNAMLRLRDIGQHMRGICRHGEAPLNSIQIYTDGDSA